MVIHTVIGKNDSGIQSFKIVKKYFKIRDYDIFGPGHSLLIFLGTFR